MPGARSWTRMAAAGLIAACVAPAHATGEITCEGVGGSDVSLSIGMGTLPVLAVISTRITAEGKTYSVRPQEGEMAIVVGQAAHEGDRTIIDYTDPNIERIVASIRLQRASEGRDFVQVGTLVIDGQGAYALSCTGP